MLDMRFFFFFLFFLGGGAFGVHLKGKENTILFSENKGF